MSAIIFSKSYVKPHQRRGPHGTTVNVDGYVDRRIKRPDAPPSQMVLFPAPEKKPVEAPFPPEVSENPERYTPDLFTGETAAEREARESAAAGPDLLTADRATYELALWTAMNARWDAGEEVTYGTSGKGYRVSARSRGALRFENGKIKFYGGKRRGAEHWYDLGPNGQAIDSLAQMLGMPTAYQRDTARYEREGPAPDPMREPMDTARIDFRISANLGVPEGDAMSELTPENLPGALAAFSVENGWDDQDRSEVEAYIRSMRPDLFKPKYRLEESAPEKYDEGVSHSITAHDADGKVVGRLGYTVFNDAPNSAGIDMITVSAEHQRRGIASDLMGKLADKVGYRNIYWGVRWENGDSLKAALDKKYGIDSDAL